MGLSNGNSKKNILKKNYDFFLLNFVDEIKIIFNIEKTNYFDKKKFSQKDIMTSIINSYSKVDTRWANSLRDCNKQKKSDNQMKIS